MKKLYFKLIIVTCLSFWACEDKISVSNLHSIQIVSSNDILMPKQSTYLYARGYDKDGNRLDKISVSWSSSNGDIASIDQEGRIEAISKGIVKITASSSQISATYDIVVSINKKRVLSEMFTSST